MNGKQSVGYIHAVEYYLATKKNCGYMVDESPEKYTQCKKKPMPEVYILYNYINRTFLRRKQISD